jgi:hypothetical protein
MEQEAKIIHMKTDKSFMGNTVLQEQIQLNKTDVILSEEAQKKQDEQKKDGNIYFLDNPDHAIIIKEHYLSKPNWRLIKIYNKYFIQYKTMILHKSAYDVLDEVIKYEKLKDDYYKENELGFDSVEEATNSLVRYMNAPQTAELYAVNLTSKETIL